MSGNGVHLFYRIDLPADDGGLVERALQTLAARFNGDGVKISGYGDTTDSVNVKSTFKNFAPRTGVSWRLTNDTVLRAGYGASTIPFPDNRYAFNYPHPNAREVIP